MKSNDGFRDLNEFWYDDILTEEAPDHLMLEKANLSEGVEKEFDPQTGYILDWEKGNKKNTDTCFTFLLSEAVLSKSA